MQQATDFAAESDALAALLQTLAADSWEAKTQFKGWTVNDILVHLHFWNGAADLSLTDADRFQTEIAEVLTQINRIGMRSMENARITERGPELLRAWQQRYRDIGERWVQLDPQRRVQWAGPAMSVRSSMTARQMETWAHGQAIYDLLGQHRRDSDRIRNVVVLGVNTFGWSYQVRGAAVPQVMPQLLLSAPSGALWCYGEESTTQRVQGSAVEFAQVVTQTRNIADTELQVCGDVATEWMHHAQCFAGPPETPPAPGSRLPTSR